MTALVLEDSIDRIDEFRKRLYNFKQVHYTDNAQNCIYLLKNNKYDIVFLDHDLENNAYVDINYKNTGSEVARWINENYDNFINKDSLFILHTLNAVGSENMNKLIKNSFRIPFVWVENVFKKNIVVNNDN